MSPNKFNKKEKFRPSHWSTSEDQLPPLEPPLLDIPCCSLLQAISAQEKKLYVCPLFGTSTLLTTLLMPERVMICFLLALRITYIHIRTQQKKGRKTLTTVHKTSSIIYASHILLWALSFSAVNNSLQSSFQNQCPENFQNVTGTLGKGFPHQIRKCSS